MFHHILITTLNFFNSQSPIAVDFKVSDNQFYKNLLGQTISTSLPNSRWCAYLLKKLNKPAKWFLEISITTFRKMKTDFTEAADQW